MIEPTEATHIQVRTLKRSAKHALLLQSGEKCAFPGCSERSYLEIAHIRAEMPGGPRHDPELSRTEDITNLLILCPLHHRLVDAQPHRYSIEFLQNLRTTAIKAANGSQAKVSFGGQQQANGNRPSNLGEALHVWDTRAGDEPEEFWQQLFEDVPELLALAIPGDTIQYGSKCYVGGKAVRNVKGNVVDFIYQSRTALAVTLVEIKKPSTKLLGPAYRHMYAPSAELIGSTMQALGYRDTLQKDFYSLARDPDERAMRVFNPKALVVIGDLETENPSSSQRRSFELFRSSLNDVIILTFDQIFGKVRDIVDITQAQLASQRV